ncbi:MAG: PEP-CTERM sorting domain-containing protein [Verrucomicrobia bacterium]|nr:PEP-CTERM sorting domain-containing protein [Verrucomicrobiota bacterium]
MKFARRSYRTSLWLATGFSFALAARGAQIPIPNGSFESPTPPPGFPAFPQVDSWQKPPQPAGLPLPAGITWDQLSGVFPNTASSSPDHIDNVGGSQAAYLFSIPGVALFQDNINAKFQTGVSYDLSLGILGGGGITDGSSFRVSLYYRDSGNNPVTVASTDITYTSAAFPNATHLLAFDVNAPAVKASDPWAGKDIGVQLLAANGTGAGYWDVDNVSLTSTSVPEPGTFGLLALGAGGLLLLRRTRRAQ